MSGYPGVSTPYVNQGGNEAKIGERGTALSITLDGAAGRYGSALVNKTIKGPSLFARQSASPYKASPFFINSAISTPTNTTNATVDVVDADAQLFKVGDTLTFYDVSGSALSTEGLVVSAVGVAGSGGGGAGFTLITLTGVWTTPPVASDLLVLSDGTELSANVVIVEGDAVYDGSNDLGDHGYVKGTWNKSKVNNTTYFVQADNQTLKLVDVQ